MDGAPPERVCASCGTRIETKATAVETAECARCGAAAGDRRGVLTRLRRQYGAARELVASPPGGSPTHAHLEWILGARRNVGLDETVFEGALSELIVLWLEDLALDLDQAAGPSGAVGDGNGGSAAAGARVTTAAGLRLATRDFAEAFLRRPESGARP